MYLWILIIAYFPSSYWAFRFHLQEREHDVFKNVPMWALDSDGIEYLGTFGNYLICEDPKSMATFTHIGKCFNSCSEKSSYNQAYFTGIYGTGSKQFSLNPRQRNCGSNIKPRKNTYLLPIRKVIRMAIKQRNMNGEKYLKSQLTTKLRKYQSLFVETIQRATRERKMYSGDNNSTRQTKRAVRTKRWSQLIVKLLIVIDYALYSLLESDFELIAQYLNIFWSAVDLKYRIVQPKISFQITGVIIAKEPNVLDYVDDSRFSYEDKDTLDVYESLLNFHKIKKYLEKIDFSNFHSIVTMSGLQGWCEEEFIYGLAFQKGICTDNKNGAIVIDDGEYFGVHNAVHELGHLLGLNHDGVNEIIDGKFGYYNCTDPRDKYGKHYIMFERHLLSHDAVLWSNCSLKYFNILESDEAVSCTGVPHNP